MADRLIRSGRYYGDGDMFHLDGEPLPTRPLLEPLEAVLSLRFRAYPGTGGSPTHPEVPTYTTESTERERGMRRVVDVLRAARIRLRRRAR